MKVNKNRKTPMVNNGIHKVPITNKPLCYERVQKPFYGHKREKNMVIHQGDMVLATFTYWTKEGYVMHNHPAFIVSTNRSILDTHRVWLIPAFREKAVGFNGEADVEVKMEECEGLKSDAHLSVNLFQCIPVSKVIKMIGHVDSDRALAEIKGKLLGQIGIKMESGV